MVGTGSSWLGNKNFTVQETTKKLNSIIITHVITFNNCGRRDLALKVMFFWLRGNKLTCVKEWIMFWGLHSNHFTIMFPELLSIEEWFKKPCCTFIVDNLVKASIMLKSGDELRALLVQQRDKRWLQNLWNVLWGTNNISRNESGKKKNNSSYVWWLVTGLYESGKFLSTIFSEKRPNSIPYPWLSFQILCKLYFHSTWS